MTGRWFRFYDEAMNDPKLLRLSDEVYRAWTILLCVASKNGGTLPPTDDIALMLRLKPVKVAEWITKLVAGGLLDNNDGVFSPHNWNSRQYKSDVTDATAAERMRKYRERKKTSDVTVTPVTDRNAVTVTVLRTDTDTDTEQIDKIAEAGASKFTEGSKALTLAFWKALGFDSPLQVPPEYAGVDWRAIGWEDAGWTADLIEAETRRIGPDKPLSYYEKVFATSFARRQAPLPIVAIRDAEKLTVSHGKPKSAIIQAADNLCRTIAGFDGPPRRIDELRSGTGEAVVRLLSNG